MQHAGPVLERFVLRDELAERFCGILARTLHLDRGNVVTALELRLGIVAPATLGSLYTALFALNIPLF